MAKSMICGAVYEYVDGAGNTKQGTLVSLTQAKDGTTTGTVLFAGFAPETLTEYDLKFQKFKLIGRPASPKIGRPRKE